MKAIILARVSSKEQEDNNSIPAQTRRLNEYALRFGLDIIDTYQLVESSTKANRTKFNDIIKQIKQSRECIALVTDTIDRLQRSFRDSVILDELRQQGKLELHFMREGLTINRSSNSADILRWDMGVMFAKSYVTQLSDNVRRSQDEKLRNGEWLSKAPFGYTNVERGKGKWIEPDANAHIVEGMFKLYASGAYSMQQVRIKLVEIYDLKKSLSQVDKILKNPFYHGVMRIKGETYFHNYTPIISEELFNLVQNRASRFKKKPFKFAGLPYYYRGIMTCGTCGCRITPERSKKEYIYYHCTQHNGKHGASYIREEALTKQLRQAFLAIQPSPEQYDEVMSSLKASHGDKTAYKERQLSILNGELQKIDNRMTKLYDSYLDDDIDKETYKTKQAHFKAQNISVRRKLDSIDSANNKFYENAQIVMNLVKDAPELFESSKIESRRQLLNIVFQNFEIHGDQLRWEYKKPFDTMASYKNHSSWLGWRDSNPRISAPKTDALPLGDIPLAVRIVH
jgi:site-specific DNA recombinase